MRYREENSVKGLLPKVLTALGAIVVVGRLLLGILSPGVADRAPFASAWPLSTGFLLFSAGLAWVTWRAPRGGSSREKVHSGSSWGALAISVGACAAAFAAFCASKYVFIFLDPGQAYPDTASYLRVAGQSIAEQTFWFGERPFTLPLLYRSLGLTIENHLEPDVIARAIRAQGFLAAGSWLLLATTVARAVRSRLGIPLAFSVVLLFGGTLHISQWDPILLSESISTSAFSLSLAMALSLMEPRGTWGTWGTRVRLGLLVVFVAVFSYTRDSNLPFLVLAGAALPLAHTLRRTSLSESGWAWIVGAVVVLAVAIFGQWRGIEFSDRWKVPYRGLLQDRILVDETATQFFLDRGMPDGDLVEAISSMDRRDFLDEVRKSDRFGPLRLWIEEEGRGTYVAYLLSQPVETALAPVRHQDRVVNPVSTEYRHEKAPSPPWLEAMTRFLYPRSSWLLLALGAVAAVSTGWSHRAGSMRPGWWLLLGLGLMAYPLMILAWYGDSVEVERHAYHAAFQLRLSLWALFVLSIDSLPAVLSSRAG